MVRAGLPPLRLPAEVFNRRHAWTLLQVTHDQRNRWIGGSALLLAEAPRYAAI